MDAKPMRCELVDEKRPEHGYLLGADVVKINDDDHRRLVEHLKTLSSAQQ
jgi:hypothetical protein